MITEKNKAKMQLRPNFTTTLTWAVPSTVGQLHTTQ